MFRDYRCSHLRRIHKDSNVARIRDLALATGTLCKIFPTPQHEGGSVIVTGDPGTIPVAGAVWLSQYGFASERIHCRSEAMRGSSQDTAAAVDRIVLTAALRTNRFT